MSLFGSIRALVVPLWRILLTNAPSQAAVAETKLALIVCWCGVSAHSIRKTAASGNKRMHFFINGLKKSLTRDLSNLQVRGKLKSETVGIKVRDVKEDSWLDLGCWGLILIESVSVLRKSLCTFMWPLHERILDSWRKRKICPRDITDLIFDVESRHGTPGRVKGWKTKPCEGLRGQAGRSVLLWWREAGGAGGERGEKKEEKDERGQDASWQVVMINLLIRGSAPLSLVPSRQTHGQLLGFKLGPN